MNAPLCAECTQPAIVLGGLHVYPHRPDLHGKWYWKCRICDAFCGCHPGTQKALGTPAGRHTRYARHKAHEAFDPLWQKGRMGRVEAYGWLAKAMGLRHELCHIGMMDKAQAERVVTLCLERRGMVA